MSILFHSLAFYAGINGEDQSLTNRISSANGYQEPLARTLDLGTPEHNDHQHNGLISSTTQAWPLECF